MDMYAFCEIFPPRLEMLESFSLHSFVPTPIEPTLSDLRFPRCPNLKEVSLMDYCEVDPLNFFRDVDFETVEKLTFGNTGGWMRSDIPCLSRYRNIHTLILKDKGAYDLDGEGYGDFGAFTGATLAHLPNLKTLLVIGHIPNYILKSIRAPDLSSLRLETDEDAHHALDTIPATLLTTPLSICVSFRPLPTPSWVPLLHLIVSKAPCLSNLFIAEWMKNALEAEGWYRKLNVVCHYL